MNWTERCVLLGQVSSIASASFRPECLGEVGRVSCCPMRSMAQGMPGMPWTHRTCQCSDQRSDPLPRPKIKTISNHQNRDRERPRHVELDTSRLVTRAKAWQGVPPTRSWTGYWRLTTVATATTSIPRCHRTLRTRGTVIAIAARLVRAMPTRGTVTAAAARVVRAARVRAVAMPTRRRRTRAAGRPTSALPRRFRTSISI